MSKEIEAKIVEILKNRVESFANVEKLDSDDDLAELGLNSVMFIKVVVGIEAEFGFEFAEEDIVRPDDFRTIKKLANYIEGKISNTQ